MNVFDRSILLFLNGFADRYPHLDVLLIHIQSDNLLKGAIFLAVIWYLWFRPARDEVERTQTREKLFAALMAMVVGIFVARLLAHLLPFRLRPIANPDLHFLVPGDGSNLGLMSWSAFPSDHAVVWFALSMGIYLVDKAIGRVVFVYALMLGVSRVYIGYHNPTDILGGAALGVGLVYLFCSEAAIAWGQRHAGAFYALAFLCTYEISNLFGEVRSVGLLTENALKLLVGAP